MIEESKTYSVMDGEPHLGKVRETTYTYDRDDIVEALIEALCEDSGATYFMLGDNEVEVGDYLTLADIETVGLQVEEKLIDDDYGTEKERSLITDLVERMVAYNASAEFDGQAYL